MDGRRAGESGFSMTDPCVAVNFHTEEFDVYVGRAGRGWNGYFGNPFKRNPEAPAGATLAGFEAYFLHRIETDPEFKRRCLELAGKRLGCPGWCKPDRCHAGIIARWVNENAEKA